MGFWDGMLGDGLIDVRHHVHHALEKVKPIMI